MRIDWLFQWGESSVGLPPGRISGPVFPACECMYFQIHVNGCISKRRLQTNTHLAVVLLLIGEQGEDEAGGVECNVLKATRASTFGKDTKRIVFLGECPKTNKSIYFSVSGASIS